MGLESLAGAAAGATPWGAIAQGAVGIGQTIFGAINAGKNQRKLENLANSYKPNAGIMDYYNKALSRYSSNPYTSSLYNQQAKMINRNVNAGIGALQDRRSGLAGISSLVQGQNDAFQKAAVGAEQQQSQALGQLGQAAQMRAQEQFKPFEMKFNLLAQKASGANKVLGAGMQNIFGAADTYSNMQMMNKMYGQGGGGTPGTGLGISALTGSFGGGGIGNKSYLNKWGGFRDLYD